MDRKIKYSQIMVILNQANSFVRYPRDFSKLDAVKAWCEALEDLPIPALKSAMLDLVANGDWPSVNEIREAVLGQDEKTQIMSAEEAFAWTWNNLNGYDKPSLDPILEKTIQNLGGWFNICRNWSNDRENQIRRNFVDIYNAAKQDHINKAKQITLPLGKETGLVTYSMGAE